MMAVYASDRHLVLTLDRIHETFKAFTLVLRSPQTRHKITGFFRTRLR
jgi:hypothetical protein